MSLLSSWDKIDVRAELLGDYVWEAEDYKTGFLSVGVDIFNQLFMKKWPISLPMVPISTKKTKIWQMRISEKAQRIEKWDFYLWIIIFLLDPSYEKDLKNEKC